MTVIDFLKNAYRVRPNAYSVFLYTLTVLLVIEVYLLGIRANYMAIAVMVGIIVLVSQFTKNMLAILLSALVIPAIGVIVFQLLSIRPPY